MLKVHKLIFTDISEWEAIKATITDEIEGNSIITDNRIVAIAIPFLTGKIPNPIEFDEEGNPLEQTFKEGYHVDVLTTEVIQEWKDITVTGASHWMHSFGMGEVVKEEGFEV